MDALKILVATAATLAVANAQDLRTVTEPVIPPACATLDAVSDKTRDTARIQSAIDACAAGHAVVLRADSTHDSFLSGPLQLRTGVTLVVDSGAILYASHDPRDYDIRPGVCGTIDQSGHGCKALINGDHVTDAGVMGDGIIDGRGGERIAGQDITWWELA